MTLPPYPKYKPSGVESLGDVPAHWEVKRLKYWASINDESLPETTDFDFEMSYVDIGSVDGVYGIRDARALTFDEAPSRARRIARDGDSIVSTVRTYLGAIAPVPDRAENLIVSTGFAVVRPRKVDPAYLSYIVRERRFIESIVSRSVGVSYPAVNAWEIGTIRVLRPPPREQRAIADYLDRKAGGLAASLEKQDSLLECLREKRAALITRTVTRGLPPKEARAAGFDPAPPLRASGVEWLGDIPAHWEVKRLKYLATINDEALPDTTPADQEMQYVDIGSVDSVKGVTTSELLTFESAPSRARRIARDGDTIVSTVRTYLRAIAAIRDPAENLIVSTGFAVVRPRRMEPAYLSYAARESRFVETVVARSVGVSYPTVNASEIATIPVPRPPEAEQRAIADYLDRETAKLDRLIGKVETAIERLREYRSALITAVVTGKVDVRGASGETGRAAAG